MRTTPSIGKIWPILWVVLIIVSIPYKARAEDIQPDHGADLNGVWNEAYYPFLTGTYNQIYTWHDETGSGGANVGTPILFDVFDGVATTSFGGTFANGFGGSHSAGIDYSCLFPSGSLGTATSTLNLLNARVKVTSQSYSASYYGKIYGDASHGNVAFGLSYNADCSAPRNDTRIDFVEPIYGTTQATSSPLTVSASGFLNRIDANDKIKVQFTITPLFTTPSSLCADVSCAFSEDRQTVITLGYPYFPSVIAVPDTDQSFNAETTTEKIRLEGKYSMVTKLYRDNSILGISSIFGIGFGQTVLDSTTTMFTMGTTTSFQDLLAGRFSDFSGATATSTEALAASCNPVSGSFSLSTCMYVLFIPSQNDMDTTFGLFKEGFLRRFPWGYVTRMTEILTNTASSTASNTLPSFRFEFWNGSALAGSYVAFDMNDLLEQGSTTLGAVTDPISGKSVRDITEPYIWLIIGLTIAVIVFHDMAGMGSDSIARGRGEGSSGNRDPSAYREWLYSHRK